jgi:hypothetical protein
MDWVMVAITPILNSALTTSPPLQRELLRQVGHGDRVADRHFTHHRRGRTLKGVRTGVVATARHVATATRLVTPARTTTGVAVVAVATTRAVGRRQVHLAGETVARATLVARRAAVVAVVVARRRRRTARRSRRGGRSTRRARRGFIDRSALGLGGSQCLGSLGGGRSFLGRLLLGLCAFLGRNLFLTGTDDGFVTQTILFGQRLLFGEIARATLPACAGCRRALRPASWRAHHP